MDKITFKPGTELTFKSVVSIRARLYNELMNNASTTFCLDLTEVTQCDSAGLALLIETRKLCKHSNKLFEVIGLSADMQSLAEFCGVKTILETG